MTQAVGTKIKVQITLAGKFTFSTPFGTSVLYKMQDENGEILVWKTSASGLCMEVQDEDGRVVPDYVQKGDTAEIKATVKAFSEYKGEKQVELTRVKVLSITHMHATEKAIAAKKQAQAATIGEGDQVITMTYKRYKEHYADCETVAGSFEQAPFVQPTIKVIVRAGRMKASGTRGEHFAGYVLVNAEGKRIVYKAICEENAIRRAEKELGGTWECVEVYPY